ncbi:uncharacterized protein [Anabrus simplex]|uniref:uncharacterized protein n=1 Tax=Anabrus simplex TaxID=316456 RepID=UPI0035A2E233
MDDETKEYSVEDLIRKSARRKDCIWKIKSLSAQEWSFDFFDGTLQLIINLKSDNVSSIYIISHTDEESGIMKLAHRYLQNKLTRDYLTKVCQTSSDVPNVLKLVEHSVKYCQEFIQSFRYLEFADTAETDGKSVTFDIANLQMHRWFYVTVDLSRWAGQRLRPEDITVRTVIGKIDQDEVRMLMRAVPTGPRFLRDFAKQVHWYVEECLKNLEKSFIRDTS